MRRRTLTFRLAATSIVWVAASLLAAGVLLVFLFRDHIERRFDRQLRAHLEELVAASEIAPSGALELTWTPSDPRFRLPYSGWYWQIADGAGIAGRSQSLWRDGLDLTGPTTGGGARIQLLTGPEGEALRAVVQHITLPESEARYTFAVAGPVSDVQADVDRFATQLSVTLGALGIGLLGAVLVQVRFGLRPLRAMRRALADIRAGRAPHLPETFPEELQPVVTELNALLDHDAAMLERARTQAGNLAHALKNPLTVIRNEARGIAGEPGRILRDQAALVGERIDRYLSRARAAGSSAVLGARTPLAATLEDLRFTLGLLYEGRGLALTVSGAEGLVFRGDPRDLEEMAGNLMDNACKWARGQVCVTAGRKGERLRIAIEDDGPGIPDERLAEVLDRGRRLDEAAPGSGLGVAIVRDLVELYRGALTIGASPLGGVRAELDLPAAE
ncbi:MAG: ATP-binding protein [Kiloniellaceae bacterium]